MLAGIREAFAGQDSPALERVAHSLKGSAASLGAGQVVAAALSLETLGRAGKVAEAQG
ncbi:MAG: Hpt domain-containing protein, partial [Armatimonadota bacterium]|nr:Hpt domain-containing protein [Armatimonadota bacterium]